MTKTPLYTTTNILLCLFLFLISLPFFVISQPPASEIEILLNIKKQWNSQPPTNSWNSSTSPCRWRGILCTDGKTVTGISLPHFKLDGKIPPTICDLKNLTTLDLHNNSIQGGFPTFLYNCSNLQTLDLSQNLLTGKLPNDINSMSPQLQYLYLSSNNFTGDIPSSIGQLKGLIELELDHNKFNGTFPSELGNLVNLVYLDLSHNPFYPMKLPTEFGKLRSLTVLIMCQCNLIGKISENFANLSSLDKLDLGENELVGEIPSGLFFLTNLKILYLNQNKLSGELPSSMEASNLRAIDLSNNNLSGQLHSFLPASLGHVPSYDYLNLSSNSFSGPIPVELALLSFDHLDLSRNHLSGKIPSAFHDSYLVCFRYNPNLCWDGTPTSYLRKCSSKSLSFRNLAIIIVLSAIVILVIMYFIFFEVILLRQGKDTAEQPAAWMMIPFHNLKFNVESIVCRLTEDNVIGSGGGGKIYCVDISDSGGKVAVKRIWNNRKFGDAFEKQFMAEAEILGRIRHTNIVKLWCCVSRADSKLLVYEYMENRSLDKWLHRKNETHESESSRSDMDQYVVLDWPTRLKIAIGVAKGLCYMHHDCSPSIIHRDVKSSNILLDSEFNAKIADFGLAKISANKVGDPHTVSFVAGSFGYIAPEYWYTKRLNEKIDIYSFGVVLLELVTGKEPCKGDEHLNLAEWSWQYYYEDHPIADSFDNEIKKHCFLEEMTKVFQLGLMCTSAVPTSRPTMKRVLQLLSACSHEEAYRRA